MPWHEQLPEDVREALPDEILTNDTLNRYNTIEDLAAGHIETRATVGQSIRIPPEEAGEEIRKEFLEKLSTRVPELVPRPSIGEPDTFDEFYTVMGVPEESADYENPEGIELPAEAEAQLREVMHGAKLTPEQYQYVAEKFSGMTKAAADNVSKARNSDMEALKGEWGAAHDDRMAAAMKAGAELYPGREFDSFTAADIRALHSHQAAVTGKPTQVAAQDKGDPGKLTPAEAMRQVDDIMRGENYWGKHGKEAQERAVARVLELREMAGGTRDMSKHRAEGGVGF